MFHSILIKSESRFPINRKKIKRHLEEVLIKEGLASRIEISLIFVGSRRMRQLNRDYREIDQATSVLSFSQTEEKAGERFVTAPTDALCLGDIVICYPEAQTLANQEGILVDEEINSLVEHGLLNLLKVDSVNSKLQTPNHK